jgi:hypothetical protein
VRIGRVDRQVGGPHVFVLVQNFLKGLAAIRGTEDAALGIRSVGMAHGGDKNPV